MSRAITVADPVPDALDVETAARMLASCRSMDQVRSVRDKAKAIAVYQRTRGASLQAQNDAAEITLRAERRMGELLIEMPKATGAAGKGRPKKGGTDQAPPKSSKAQPPTLAELHIERKEAARWQKLAEIPEERFAAHVNSVRARSERITTSGVIAAASHVEGYDSDEFYTPSQHIEAARAVLGDIDLDPASNVIAQAIVLARRYFTRDDDGLAQVWSGRVWMNPPYSQPLANLFIEKLIAAYLSGQVPAAICLMNASTDTGWFHELASHGLVCLTRGRISFLGPDGRPVEGNRVGQAFFYLGEDRGRFAEVFGQFGIVTQRFTGGA